MTVTPGEGSKRAVRVNCVCLGSSGQFSFAKIDRITDSLHNLK